MSTTETIFAGTRAGMADWERRIAAVARSVDFGRHCFDMRREFCIRPSYIGCGSLAAHAAHASIDFEGFELPDSVLNVTAGDICAKGKQNLGLSEGAAQALFYPELTFADWRSSAADPGYISHRKAVRCLELLQHTRTVNWKRASEDTATVNRPSRSCFMIKLLHWASVFSRDQLEHGLFRAVENALSQCNYLPGSYRFLPGPEKYSHIVKLLALAAEISVSDAKDLLLPVKHLPEISSSAGLKDPFKNVVGILRDTGKVDWRAALDGKWRDATWFGGRWPNAAKAVENTIRKIRAAPDQFDMNLYKEWSSSMPRNLAAYAACAYAERPADMAELLVGRTAHSILQKATDNLQLFGDIANEFFFPPDARADCIGTTEAVRFLQVFLKNRESNEFYYRSNGSDYWRQAMRETTDPLD